MNPIKDNIVSALNIENLPKAEQEKRLADIGSIIFQNVLMRVLEKMPEKQQDEFEKMLDSNANPEEIFEFLNKNTKDFQKVITEEALKFKDNTENIMSQIG
jgi:succinate dehydrogenase flavin-adding protein (antitoxin of CptAB toxin-antitoxin module)